ncbi:MULTISPECIES: DUF6457 domain-containing protein [Cryobacterium]|uniref:DUF6457 domain-containing protein n=1 Tax=Cryobacterium zongtaii TaxID=1259217 RepID=A0A2S3ZLA6_9MICO|nr:MULTISPECIES: DUF6457 domain-containing protein [Cryobacterium]ASD21605.1 hypothetical protein B7495_05430 [Cryobacterium sp. LW097]MEC5183599.1 hypothetical protein [Cryobacterium sp. MP_3.1]POH63121.1 hypothetical protein C3B60_17410 [Cryobacterium zongtaii]POH68840.1 hypothetical protein C3B61_02725 [Cryobacterium zongtaii]TFC43757.1 hypothetical protein E3O57_13105 [Cryobacterium sp. TMN-39-2]
MNAPENDTGRLDDLSQRLTQALQILDLKVDYPLLLDLAAETTRAVGPAGGPISTFLVGYAAGMTSTSSKQATTDAVERAVGVARQATRKSGDGGIDDGWANTAQ